MADEDFNSKLGSKVDGKLANDFLILRAREEADARGYSNKPPIQAVKNAKLKTGEPVQATLSSKYPLKIFDVVKRKYLSPSDSRAGELTLSFKMDIDIRLRFTAKVALAAGYFAYGDGFVENVDHEQFRIILNFDGNGEQPKCNARVFDKLLIGQDKASKKMKALIQACELMKASCVLLVPGDDSFGVAVGILGQFVGFINVPSRSENLKRDDLYKMGHCIYLQQDEIVRMSMENLLAILIQRFGVEI